MSQRNTFDRAVASLHEAALDDSCWHQTSALIDAACGTKGNHLVILDSHPRAATGTRPEWLFDQLLFRGELRPELAREYLHDFFPHDERIPRLMKLPDQRVTHVSTLYDERELKTSPTYNDLLLKAECHDSLHVRMNGPDGLDIVLVFADPVAPGELESGSAQAIERIVPHIRQFVRVRHALAGAEGLAATLADLLGNDRVGVICLDRRGMIVNTNANARAMLRKGDGVTDRAGVLRADRAADDARLGTLLRTALPVPGRRPGSGSMTVERSPLLPRLVLHVQPVNAGTVDSAESLGAATASVAVLVLLVEPGIRTSVDAGLVAETFRLTPAESQVAAALAEGSTIRAIAQATHRKEGTVRWYLKQIHAKCGVTRREDLVRLVGSVAPPSGRH